MEQFFAQFINLFFDKNSMKCLLTFIILVFVVVCPQSQLKCVFSEVYFLAGLLNNHFTIKRIPFLIQTFST